MNPIPSLAYWGQLAASLAIEAVILVCLAELLQYWTRSTSARRAIWQAVMVALLLVTWAEICGLSRIVAISIPPSRVSGGIERLGHDAPITISFKQATPELLHPGLIDPKPGLPAAKINADKPIWWPGLIWFAGFVWLMVRVLFGRSLFWISQCRSEPIVPDFLAAQVQRWARQLGLRSPVRFATSRQLTGPIAYGVWHPIIGLPDRFLDRVLPQQQLVMLLHELAHLRARDPLWRLISDVVTAHLWWHPAVWWSRRQLFQATEMAADEASLLIPRGPRALAECLVEMGHQLRRSSSLAWLGILGDGFRSSLGRRVSRLLRIADNNQCLRPAKSSGWLIAMGLIPAFTLTALATSCLVPQIFTLEKIRARSPAESWQRSLAGIALAAISSPAETADKGIPPAGIPKNSPSSSSPTRIDPRLNHESGAQLMPRLFRVDRLVFSRAILKHSGRVDETHSDRELLQDFLTTLGVQIQPPKSVVFNDRAGVLFIRATPEELDLVQAALNPEDNADTAKNEALASTNSHQLFSRLYKVDPPTFMQGVQRTAKNEALASTNSHQLFSRVYKVDPPTFMQGVQRALSSSNITNLSQNDLQDQIRRLFSSATGVDFKSSPTNGADNNPKPVAGGADKSSMAAVAGRELGPAIFFNDRTGLLYARATFEELDAVEGVVTTLNMTPPQVRIETIFAEIPEGIDWRTLPLSKTNELSIVTELQFREIKSAFEKINSVKVIFLPALTTLSGRQAQIKETQQNNVTVPSGNPSSTSTPDGAITLNTIESGACLDVVPQVLANDAIRLILVPSYTMDATGLILAPSYTNFSGYGTTNHSAQPDVQLPVPRTLRWSVTNVATIWSGQTIICSPLTNEAFRKSRDKVPVLSDLPIFGRLFRSYKVNAQKTNLFVFVTATVIDPAGNPEHGRRDMPPPKSPL